MSFPLTLLHRRLNTRSVPTDPKGGYSIEMYKDSMEEFAFPGGSYWVAAAQGKAPPPKHRTAGQTVH